MKSREQKAIYDATYQAAYRIANRERISARKRAAYAANPEKMIFSKAKYRAEKDGVPFDIGVEDIIIPELCPIFGFPLVVGISSTAGVSNSPSLDRIIPKKGYVKGNVWVISNRANIIKNNATWQELAQISEAVRKKIEEAKTLGVD